MDRAKRAGAVVALVSVLATLSGTAEAAGSLSVARVRLFAGGEEVEVRLSISCDPIDATSWAAVAFTLVQGRPTGRYVEGFGTFGAIGFYGLECDRAVHDYSFSVVPTAPYADRLFHAGPARFEAVVTVCDLVDPATETYDCTAPDGLLAGRVRIIRRLRL